VGETALASALTAIGTVFTGAAGLQAVTMKMAMMLRTIR